jgi:hypothetical protein
LLVWDYFNPILQFFPATPSPFIPLPLHEGEGGGNLKEGLKPLLTPVVYFKIFWQFFPIPLVEQVRFELEKFGFYFGIHSISIFNGSLRGR